MYKKHLEAIWSFFSFLLFTYKSFDQYVEIVFLLKGE